MEPMDPRKPKPFGRGESVWTPDMLCHPEVFPTLFPDGDKRSADLGDPRDDKLPEDPVNR
jgi:hypothetical protein